MITDIHMIPAGYMAKRISQRPDWIKNDAIKDIYSISGCISEDFSDYINYWKHNGYWLFDSSAIIHDLAKNEKLDLLETKFFYYEIYEQQYDEKTKIWTGFNPESSFTTNVSLPETKTLEGYDVVNFFAQNKAECSPLSCNNLAADIEVNSHCLFASFKEAKEFLENGKFDNSEPGPFRIFAVYSLPEN